MHMHALQCTALQTVCSVNFEVLRICPILTEKTKDGGLYAQIISLFSCGIKVKFTHVYPSYRYQVNEVLLQAPVSPQKRLMDEKTLSTVRTPL